MSPKSILENLRSRLAGTHRVGEIGALISIVLAIIFFGTVLGREMKYLSYDIPFIFRPNVEITNAVIVYMDAPSNGRLNQMPGVPYHRALHVQLLRKLREAGAAAVVFDVVLKGPWHAITDIRVKDEQLRLARQENPDLDLPNIPPEQVDEQLVKAVQDHGNVVLAAEIEIKSGVATATNVVLDNIDFAGPFEALADSAAVGVINIFKDPGLIEAVRRHYHNPGYTSLASAVARAMGRPVESSPSRWINFYGPPLKIPWISYHRVLQVDGPSTNLFAGKIVFVGKSRVTTFEGQSPDELPTPYNLQKYGKTSGVEIQATACLNYLRGDWLTELSDIRHLVLFVASGVFFGVLFAFVRPWIAVVLAVVGFLGVAFAGIQTVWQTHTWFSWMIIGAVQIPTALGWALLINTRRLYRQNLELEEALKTATATPPATSSPDAPTILAPARTLIANPAAGALPRGADWVAHPGDLIGDYQTVKCVGEGAYGQVWLARNVIGTYVALKLVYRNKFRDDAPFEREFQGLKRFMPISRRHPGFVQILHVGKSEGFFYYVMEAGDDEVTQQAINPDHYSPRNLSGDLQRRGKLPLGECLKLGVDLTNALRYLHEQNLIHRDIKPSNIIFVNGQPKIADIGLVTVMATSRPDSTYIGTPGYIPPEGPGTAAADVYSLGKVIYEASMGRHVSNYPALPTTLIERDDYKSLVELNDIIIKACADNVSLRYQTASELHDALAGLQTRLVKHAT